MSRTKFTSWDELQSKFKEVNHLPSGQRDNRALFDYNAAYLSKRLLECMVGKLSQIADVVDPRIKWGANSFEGSNVLFNLTVFKENVGMAVDTYDLWRMIDANMTWNELIDYFCSKVIDRAVNRCRKYRATDRHRVSMEGHGWPRLLEIEHLEHREHEAMYGRYSISSSLNVRGE